MAKKLFYLVSLLLATILVIVSYVFRYEIHDWYVLRSYEPPAEVEILADRTGMSDKGRQLFYVHDPQILAAEEFNTACPDREASVVLGCYDGRYVYVFDVTNQKLDGVREITAAHEMLHAVYARLNESDKQELISWLNVAKADISNQRIKNVISSYKDLNIDDLNNELHSIIGTEVRDLPEFLEDHYGQYFSDRLKLIDISERYESVFTEIQSQIKDYDDQLAGLSLNIRLKERNLEIEAEQLNGLRQRLEVHLQNNQTNDYNQLVPIYNNAVNNYNSLVASLKASINQYNQIVSLRNQLGVEQNDLVKSIDSRFNELEKE